MPRARGKKRTLQIKQKRTALAARRTHAPARAVAGFEEARKHRLDAERVIDGGPRRRARKTAQESPQASASVTVATMAPRAGVAEARPIVTRDIGVQTTAKRLREHTSYADATPEHKRKIRCKVRAAVAEICYDFDEMEPTNGADRIEKINVDAALAIGLDAGLTDSQYDRVHKNPVLRQRLPSVSTLKRNRARKFGSVRTAFGITECIEEHTASAMPEKLISFLITGYGLEPGAELRLKLVVDDTTAGREDNVWFLLQVRTHVIALLLLLLSHFRV